MRTSYPTGRLSMKAIAPEGMKFLPIERFFARDATGDELTLREKLGKPLMTPDDDVIEWEVENPMPTLYYAAHISIVRK